MLTILKSIFKKPTPQVFPTFILEGEVYMPVENCFRSNILEELIRFDGKKEDAPFKDYQALIVKNTPTEKTMSFVKIDSLHNSKSSEVPSFQLPTLEAFGAIKAIEHPT